MSFVHYLETNIYRHTNLPAGRRFTPLAVDDYESLIQSAGGLDLIMVGIGHNGHIAFNEPGTPKPSWTHCTWLTESTRHANAGIFGSADRVPTTAVTMGVQTILAARRVFLIASGQQKHGILERALSDGVTSDLPASFLQEHPNLEVFTDFHFARI
jgi:glucosamine-6-phosphate deaminase